MCQLFTLYRYIPVINWIDFDVKHQNRNYGYPTK